MCFNKKKSIAEKQIKMSSHLVTRIPQSFRLVAMGRQFTVGATLSAKSEPAKSQPVQDPVKKLFLDKIKVIAIASQLYD